MHRAGAYSLVGLNTCAGERITSKNAGFSLYYQLKIFLGHVFQSTPRQILSSTSISMEAHQEFDFIIVGGGTAGLVVANRLTEDADTSVLVLEAGSDRTKDPRITIPGMSSALYDNPEFDWAFRSVPQVRSSFYNTYLLHNG